MKNKFFIWFYSILLLVLIIGFIFIGKFVWFDCEYIILAGYTQEIGLGMGLILFMILGMVIPSCLIEFIKFCKSSGSPVDK